MANQGSDNLHSSINVPGQAQVSLHFCLLDTNFKLSSLGFIALFSLFDTNFEVQNQSIKL